MCAQNLIVESMAFLPDHGSFLDATGYEKEKFSAPIK